MEHEHILLALLELIMSFRPKLENGGICAPTVLNHNWVEYLVNLLSNVGEVSRSFMLSTLENAPRAVTNNGCAYSKAARGAPRRKIRSIVAPCFDGPMVSFTLGALF